MEGTWASILPVTPTIEILQTQTGSRGKETMGVWVWRSCGSLWPQPLTSHSTEGPWPRWQATFAVLWALMYLGWTVVTTQSGWSLGHWDKWLAA